MRRSSIVLALAFAAAAAWAQTKEPIALRDMGSFHVGGRIIEITGQPIKEVVFTPGGVPAKMDPNGKYQVEQVYVQYSTSCRKTARASSRCCCGTGVINRRHLRDQARRWRRLAHLFHSQGLGH